MKLGWIVAALITLVAGKLWLVGHDADLRATQALREKDAALARLTDTVQSLAVQYDRLQDRTDSIVLSRDSAIMSDSVLADSLKNAEVVRYVELRGAVPKNLQPLVDSLQSTHAAQLAAKDSIIGSWKGEVSALIATRQAADSLIATQGRALQTALSQRDAWKERASPGVVEQVRRGLPWMAVGGLVVLILRH